MQPAVAMSARVSTDARRLLAKTNPGPVLREVGQYKVDRMIRGLRRGGDPIEGQAPVSRSGGRGFGGRMTSRVLDAGRRLRYGNSSRQARILHFGGIIRPRKARALTIPAWEGPGVKIARGKRARDIPGLFRIGNALFIKRGKTNVLVFALCKQVRIRKHPWGLPWDGKDNAKLMSILRRGPKAA